ncbi:MAG: c-type cytochrome domain-containing protein [Bacteroidota bacterium]|nr:c-type cytochrome domain-containing protein [Bacteroidota bacterium]
MEAIFFLGRFHPLLVHLPIGFLILAILIESYCSIFKIKINHRVINFTWFIAFFSSVLTTILGLLVAETGHYIDENLFMHKIFGLSLTAISFISWFLRLSIFSNLFSSSLKTLSNTIIIVLLTLTGHYGGNLTHGETYLVDYAPENIKELVVKKNKYVELEIDSVKVYDDLIQPIFNQKCVSCHNKEISRGNLNMDSYSNLLKGGSSGIPINKSDPRKSLLIRRITMPTSELKYMPPDGEPVSFDEIKTLIWWINNFDKSNENLVSLKVEDDIKESLEMLYSLNFTEKQWFEKISTDKLDESLVQNIDKRVFQIKFISDDKKFLSVKYLQKNVSVSDIEKLEKISKYIAYFTAKSSNISNELIKGISNFENLVKLEIQDNNIDDESIKILQSLKNLEILNIHNTKITNKSIEILKEFKNLKRAYVWGTSISRSEIDEFNRKEEKLKLIGGS